ncbi:MAG: hypothetical protein AAGL24_24155 [Pseudomonadota bacterium]
MDNVPPASADDPLHDSTPALEIGGKLALYETSANRPYARAGTGFPADRNHGLPSNFSDTASATWAISITSDFDDILADVAAGATAFFDNASSLGLAYEGLISSDTQQHGISVKGTWRF